MNEARYPKVDWALRYAYIAEASKGRHGSMDMSYSSESQDYDDFQLFMKRITSGLSRDEMIADGLMLKNTIMQDLDRNLGRIARWVIGARYRIPNDKSLNYCKQSDYQSLASEMRRINKNLTNKWFVVDMIRGAMEGTHRQHHSIEDWARKMGVSDKTVYRYASSRDPGYKSIKIILNRWEAEAIAQVEIMLIEDGQII
jgi:hypothetical protein